ncbi:MAG: ABC transporter ATP-binding protein [Nitrososphaerota archaeon]
MERPLLEVRSVDLYYGPLQVVWGASLEVQAGSIVAIVGPNGAGKTTLLKGICGMVKPKKGEVLFDGVSLVGLTPEEVVQLGVCYVPEGRHIFSTLSVYENLKIGAYLRRAREAFAQNLKKVYRLFPVLEERKGQAGGTLSGGEQQMLAIARALMSEPKLLLLDEPSLGLSPLIVKHLFQLLMQLKGMGITIVLVEQNVFQALKIADFAYVMKNGMIVAQGTGEELLRDPELWSTYIKRRTG